jgi:hypothetical protein
MGVQEWGKVRDGQVDTVGAAVRGQDQLRWVQLDVFDGCGGAKEIGSAFVEPLLVEVVVMVLEFQMGQERQAERRLDKILVSGKYSCLELTCLVQSMLSSGRSISSHCKDTKEQKRSRTTSGSGLRHKTGQLCKAKQTAGRR